MQLLFNVKDIVQLIILSSLSNVMHYMYYSLKYWNKLLSKVTCSATLSYFSVFTTCVNNVPISAKFKVAIVQHVCICPQLAVYVLMWPHIESVS